MIINCVFLYHVPGSSSLEAGFSNEILGEIFQNVIDCSLLYKDTKAMFFVNTAINTFRPRKDHALGKKCSTGNRRVMATFFIFLLRNQNFKLQMTENVLMYRR